METRLSHDKIVCISVLLGIEARLETQCERITFPDQEDSSNKAIDMLASVGSHLLAFEHTRIESFPGQIEDDVRFAGLLNPLEEEFKRAELPPGSFRLAVDIQAVAGAKDPDAIRSALSDWILKTAPTLTPGKQPGHFVTDTPEGVPFEVTLYAFPQGSHRYFNIRNAPEDIEERRRERLRKALDDKLPKLLAARSPGLETVLVLESDDPALGCATDIATALVSVWQDVHELPNRCFLVETQYKDPWMISEITLAGTQEHFPLEESIEISLDELKNRVRLFNTGA